MPKVKNPIRPKGKRKKGKPVVSLIGKQFGNLTVISFSEVVPKRGAHWNCLCICGATKRVSSERLRRGYTKSCGCLVGKKGKDSPYWKGHGSISGSRWKGIELAAKSRNLEFSITIEEVWNLYINQEKKCALTGVSINLENKGKNNTASLDRIDSSKGYTLDNIQWIHKIVQKIKWDLSELELIKWCQKIVSHKDGTRDYE